MNSKSNPVGLATYLGIAAAVVQYVTAMVILIAGGPTEAAIGALGTATVALVGVLTGRYAQANTRIKEKKTAADTPAKDVWMNNAPVSGGSPNVSISGGSKAEYWGEIGEAPMEEPGDHFDAHPDIPVTPPEQIMADNIDPPVELWS